MKGIFGSAGRDEFPSSEQDARSHIRKIRLDRGADEVTGDLQVGPNIEDLQAALKVLSDDLYQTSTHFLLELIQNADDNHYATNEPTIILTRGPGTFRFDCNETGFTKANVESICRIGRSTKKGQDKSTGYVGEKGIGFKSVFKVALEVWISSGHYSFKFSRDGPLGMVIPSWAQFPERLKPGFTSIFLQLAMDYNDAELTQELASFDSRLLIFLRRLRRIEITVNTGTNTLDTKVLTRRDISSTITELAIANKVAKHFVHRHAVTGLPHEDRRPGITSSDILLAFPFESNGRDTQPIIARQPLFAFLPVRNYGFPFLLQADFLLVASREDIDSSEWNTALLHAAVDAYHGAIEGLVKIDSSMRYAWVRYLPIWQSQRQATEKFRSTLLERLRESNVLESQSGSSKPPSSLLYVPKDFRDEEDIPITLTRESGHRYLSHHYQDSDFQYLQPVGVKELAKAQFLADLKACLAERTASSFPKYLPSQQRADWHSKLAKILLKIATWEELADFPIIPLRDGTWATPSQVTFFPDERGRHEIPEGIEIPVLERRAAEDKDRRLLFTFLGVKNFREEDVARVIADTHQLEDFRPESLKVKVLVSHAKFLFKAGWRNIEKMDLWIATEDGRFLRASSTYLRTSEPGAASNYLQPSKDSSYGFAHSEYLRAFDAGNAEWKRWLLSELYIAIFPRLIESKYVDPDGFPTTDDPRKVIHRDFLSILERPSALEFLTVLGEGWDGYYSDFLGGEIVLFRSRFAQREQGQVTAVEMVATYLRRFLVPCSGGLDMVPLEETSLPVPMLQKDAPWCRSFLDIPDHANPRWRYLTFLGVTTSGDLKFYLQCLRHAKALVEDFSRVPYIMQQIQARAAEDVEYLRKSMEKENLICRPTKQGPPQWLSLENCIWDGEDWLRRVASLRHLYPECGRLFKETLRCPRLDVRHIILELQGIRPSCSADYISAVFALFKSMHESGRYVITEAHKANCQKFEMFPVTTSSTKEGYDKLVSLSTPDWFVADKMLLRNAFHGALTLLAFDVANVTDLMPIFKVLQMESRLLSQVAKRTIITEGDVTVDKDLTMKYRSRGSFIARLVPREHASRSLFLKQLQHLTVRSCNQIFQRWTVNVGRRNVQSPRMQVPAVIEKTASDELEIILRPGYGSDEPPLELAEQLGDYLNVGMQYRNLLFLVLMPMVKLAKLQQSFQEAGVPEYTDNWEFKIEGGYEGYTGKDETQPRALGVGSSLTLLMSDADSLALSPFEPYCGSGDGLRSVSGGFSSILILFPSTTGAHGISSASSGRNQSRTGGSKGALPLLVLKGTISKIGASKEQFLGEKTVSAVLEAILGQHYQPDSHWTSHHRVKAGFADYPENDNSRASFTVPDQQGRLAHFLAHNRYKQAAKWMKSSVMYHIEVMSTSESHETPFSITKEEFERAMSHSPSRIRTDVPQHVSLWVRISNVKSQSGAKVAFLVDPWHLWMSKRIQIDSLGGFVGQCS